MLSVNPGLKSRFSERVHFHDFDANATVELLQMELERKDIPAEVRDLNDLCRLAQKLVDSEGFGNGRDVVTWADKVYKQVAKKHSRNVPTTSSRRARLPISSSLEDIEMALDLLLSSREARQGGPQCSTSGEVSQPLPTMLDTVKVDAPPPPIMATKKREEVNEEKEEQKEDTENPMTPGNAFDGIDRRILQGLQDYTEKEGLDSEEGAQRLSNLNPASAEFMDLLARLVDATGMEPDAAREQLIKWQKAQKKLKRMVEETKTKIVGARPIWRCAVCGQANKPWIVCYVAPYIADYEQVTVGDK
jgi:hypothetical protein